jgi:hypothetical protein
MAENDTTVPCDPAAGIWSCCVVMLLLLAACGLTVLGVVWLMQLFSFV